MTRTNSWTSRKRRRRRRASQARTLARWTGSCGNILPKRGGLGSPLARPSHFPHPGPGPFRPAPHSSYPRPLWSVSQLPSSPAPVGPGCLSLNAPHFPPIRSPHSSCPWPRLPEPPSAAQPHAVPRPWWTGSLGGPSNVPDVSPALTGRSLLCEASFLPFASSSPQAVRWTAPSLHSSLAGNRVVLGLDR